jgi:hypothetical protein
MREIALIAILLLTACSIKAKPFVGPSGGTAYSMECDELDECYKKAREMCPSGYAIIDRATEPIGSTAEHTLAIECKLKGPDSL